MIITSVENFRGLGGLKTTAGETIKPLMFRSGHLTDLSQEDGALLTANKLRHVVDYRSPPEVKFRPVALPATWTPNHVSAAIGGNASAWIKDLFDRLKNQAFPAEDLEEQFLLAYRNIPLENHQGIKLLFDTLLAAGDGEATLFHCTAGKDRTGVSAALILKALGVHDDDILADFMATNDAVDLEAKSADMAVTIAKRSGIAVTPTDIWPLVGVKEHYLTITYDAITGEYGSIDNYLEKALGLTADKREQLKSMYLG